MRIRFPFKVARERPAFIGNEMEEGALIDLEAKTVTGFYGAYTELPADPREPAVRHTSEAFLVQLTDEDVANIRAIVEAQITALGAKPTYRYDMTLSTPPKVKVVPSPFEVELTIQQIDMIANIVFARAIEQGVADLDPTSSVVKVV